MPRTKISEFSATPANNTDIDSINIAEGCAPSGINDAIRELMAQLKDFQTGAVGDSFNGPVGSSTAAAGAFTTLSASSTLAVTGVATLTAQPILSSLTASRAVFTDASKGLVSNAITGTGNVVMSTSPTLVTPVLGAATGTSFQGIIGNVTPAAGAFTTVDASGAVTLSGGTANGVTYLNGSKVLTSGSALTFDGTNFATTGSGTLKNLLLSGGTLPAAGNPSIALRSSDNVVYHQSGSANNIVLLDSAQNTMYSVSATAHSWNISNANALTLNSSSLYTASGINVGFGNSNPSSYGRLQVKQSGTAYNNGLAVTTSANDSSLFIYDNGSAWKFLASYLSTGSYKPIIFNTSDIDRLTLDVAGNLGLGVTPSAWDSLIKVVELNNGVSYGAQTDSEPVLYLGVNNYYGAGADRYKVSSKAASRYRSNAGAHFWFTAPAGTAGNPITFTQAMTLNADGQLLLGTTSAFDSAYTMSLKVAGATGGLIIQPASDGYTAIQFNNAAGTGRGSISVSSTLTTYNVSSDYRLKNITGPITTSGAYIDSLNPVEGTWKEDGSTFVGLIAHEVQEASRTTVATGTKDGAEMQGMDYSSAEIIANLIAEVKSLRVRVAQLETN